MSVSSFSSYAISRSGNQASDGSSPGGSIRRIQEARIEAAHYSHASRIISQTTYTLYLRATGFLQTMSTVLIIGATGYGGNQIVNILVQSGQYAVYDIARTPAKAKSQTARRTRDYSGPLP